MRINFYVTPLDPSCSVVLGYNWLTRYNLLIDWVLGSIIFRPQLLDPSTPISMLSARAATLPQQTPIVSDDPLLKPVNAPHISLIGVVPFMRACKLPGAQCYRIHLSDPSISGKAMALSDDVPDLSRVPEEYRDYADVFNKEKAYTLAPHRPYDLKIDLEEGTSPPVVPMYPLSPIELETL
jgi:hypothetical protein